jgi:hypothetical protein
MLINFTNHPSDRWTDDQKNSAIELYGTVKDLPFPPVPTSAGASEVIAMADGIIDKILEMKAESPETFAVMAQGEFTLTYAVVSRLKGMGITVVSAVSERVVTEQVENGEVRKTALFRFAGFREYA